MIRPVLTLCCCLLGGWALLSAAHAQEQGWSPAATYEGVPYQSVEELRSFYKFTTGVQPLHKGALATMALDGLRLELGPGRRELNIGGQRLELAYPLLREQNGQLLISREDWISWVDPILRPTYIPGRSAVRCVVLDPALGGSDDEASSREAAITLQVAQRLKTELEAQGYQVILTRTGDYFLSDQQRVNIANAARNALFLSLHLNSGRADFRGARVYTLAPAAPHDAPRPGDARRSSQAALAYAVQSALVRQAGAEDGGCHHAHYSLLSSISCPAVWVELGYATHEQEGAALATPTYQDTLAQALALGIATYAKVADPATSIPIQEAPPKVVVKAPQPAPKKTTQTTQKKPTTPPAKKGKTGSSNSRQSSSSKRNSAAGFRQNARNSRTRTR